MLRTAGRASFYRTYEELKLFILIAFSMSPERFYRTYEELKPIMHQEFFIIIDVFIVPMRN